MQFAHLHIARYIALQSDFERHFKSQSDFSRHLLAAASRILSAILDFRRHDQFAVYMAVGQGDLEFKRHFSRHRTLQFWTPDCRNSEFLHEFSQSQPIATGDFVEGAAHVVNWMRVDGKLGGFAAGVGRRGRRCAFAGGSVWTSLGHLVGLTPV